jgi:predicted O-linked N-acetylglucosamine transferase (SPINDLY family)
VEKLVRLPQGFLCYEPPGNAPPVRDYSTAGDGPVVFGTFNNFAKVTPQIIALWSQILLAVPKSKLLIKAETLGDEETQQMVRGWFARHGVDGSRIELLGREPSFVKHLATYHRVDIGLDTFPYHGTTTTCEAMWMGVPVLTLAGKAHVSRVGVSLLTRVGLSELMAPTPADYVKIAAELAQDVSRRRQIAGGLRDRMRASPLTDARGFVANLESAYRQIWRDRCAT